MCRPPERQTRMGGEGGTVWLRLVAVLRLLFVGSTFFGSARQGRLDRPSRTGWLADWGGGWTGRTRWPAQLDRIGHDPDGRTLIFVMGLRSYLVTLRR